MKLNFEAMFAGVSAAGKAGKAGQAGQTGQAGQAGKASPAASEFSALLDAIRAGKVAHKFSETMPQAAPEAEGDATPHQTAPQAAGEIRARLGAAKRGHAPTQTPHALGPATRAGSPASNGLPRPPSEADLPGLVATTRAGSPASNGLPRPPLEADLPGLVTQTHAPANRAGSPASNELAAKAHAPVTRAGSPASNGLAHPPLEADLPGLVTHTHAPANRAGSPASEELVAETPHTADPDQFSDALKNLPIPPEATPQQPAAAPVDAADVQVVAEPAETPREPLPAQKESFLRVSDRQLQWPKTEQKARPDAMPQANVAGDGEAAPQLSEQQPSKPQASKQAAETREDAMQTAETQQTKPQTEKTSATAQSASESTQQQHSQQQPQQNQHNQHNKLPLPGLERMMQNLPRGQAQAPQAPVASRFDAPLVAPEAMAERIRIATTRDGGEARFAVDTPDGRQIEVELKVRNSTAELTLRGESDEMLRHMERTAKELTRALRDSGLQTGSVSVESQSPQTGQGRDGRKEAHNPSGHKATSGAPGEGREAGDGAPSAPRKNHDGLVYVVA
ncbi:hypothetical protein FIV42_11455 [Persicimonas caeni]|uniref:Flagellar hook-length control protein-like C-terminal domain-containing protein n=1 Tax=Persicimonas caeni TaxID=2292766 RepID=A0A4Y6PSM4_PERCE|nr:flagellar hook-length control protein FliK [Persicimonas caeni]QDG51334.1 hypothetical protein FIV42_11455 [Persicimonas caeni]QED32555.1 hypothetical protein FRD00_11450 [Persicimonas caeni]